MWRMRDVAIAGVISALGAVAGGCGDPCAELEHKVCEKLHDKRRCELMQDIDRREKLGSEACQSILKSLDRR
jgi:hypothetical protein